MALYAQRLSRKRTWQLSLPSPSLFSILSSHLYVLYAPVVLAGKTSAGGLIGPSEHGIALFAILPVVDLACAQHACALFCAILPDGGTDGTFLRSGRPLFVLYAVSPSTQLFFAQRAAPAHISALLSSGRAHVCVCKPPPRWRRISLLATCALYNMPAPRRVSFVAERPVSWKNILLWRAYISPLRISFMPVRILLPIFSDFIFSATRCPLLFSSRQGGGGCLAAFGTKGNGKERKKRTLSLRRAQPLLRCCCLAYAPGFSPPYAAVAALHLPRPYWRVWRAGCGRRGILYLPVLPGASQLHLVAVGIRGGLGEIPAAHGSVGLSSCARLAINTVEAFRRLLFHSAM